MQENADPRDAIIAELHQELASLIKISREAAEKTDELMELQERAHVIEMDVQANTLRAEAADREIDIRRQINSIYASSIETHANVLAALTLRNSAQRRVNAQAVAPSVELFTQKLEALSVAVETMLEGGAPGPLMSEALEWWHHEIRVPQRLKGSKSDNDYSRLKEFIAFAGDKPVNRYRFADFQQYATLLALVPANYMKLP